jgi:hypothetical protein
MYGAPQREHVDEVAGVEPEVPAGGGARLLFAEAQEYVPWGGAARQGIVVQEAPALHN